MKKKMKWVGIAAVLAAGSLHAGIVTNIVSFQQNDLRVDGNLVDAAYQTGSVTLRSSAPDTVETSTGMYIGSHLASSIPQANRGLFAFDLSYIETLAAGNPYTINSISFILTVSNARTLAETLLFSAYATDSFNETTATWNNPGAGHAAGGNIGALFASTEVTSAMANANGTKIAFNASVPGNMATAIANALAGDKMLYIMVKHHVEDGAVNKFFRAGSDSHTTVEYRPELLVTVIPEPATLGLLGIGTLLTILLRRMKR
jgi:hypothetical protein